MAQGDAFLTLEAIGIPQITMALSAAERAAQAAGLPALAQEIYDLIMGLLADVNRVSVEIAGTADGMIVAKILESRHSSRPASGDMESHIVSEPGPLGLVRVALIDELDKIVNPEGGYGTFWRAQEYGTGSDVPSQVGRQIFGIFEPSETAPDPRKRGLGEGEDRGFISGANENAGLGRISVELPARHFLTDGSDAAAAAYEQAIMGVQLKWNRRIEAIIAQARVALRRRQGSFVGIVEA